jgi:hypothetical protein
MMQMSPGQFETILPLAVEWAKAKEKVILERGTVLYPQHMRDAESIVVRYPNRVRIYELPQIPIPKHPILRAAAKQPKSFHRQRSAFHWGMEFSFITIFQKTATNCPRAGSHNEVREFWRIIYIFRKVSVGRH